MRRVLTLLTLALATVGVTALPAHAGSPHFVDDQTTFTVDGSTLTVTGKEAGLGDEAQIHVVVTAVAACVNPGGNKPQAANKVSVQAEGDFPVQHGSAEFELVLTAVFQPECSPPMEIAWSGVVVADVTNGISVSL